MINSQVKDTTLDSINIEAFALINTPTYWADIDKYEQQYIYIDSQPANDGEQPDLIRIADTEKRITQPVGVLETISEDDFKYTEVLVFRESSGELIVQRKGLRDNEYDARQKIGYWGQFKGSKPFAAISH